MTSRPKSDTCKPLEGLESVAQHDIGMDNEAMFTGLQLAETQMNLRDALGLPVEHFPLGDCLKMMQEEITALRVAGKSDTQIANLIKVAVGIIVPPEAIGKYVPA